MRYTLAPSRYRSGPLKKAITIQTVTMASRGKMAVLPYVADPRDTSLESYMIEALYLLELRFEYMDEDGAG